MDVGLATITSNALESKILSDSLTNYPLVNLVLVATVSGNIMASTLISTRLFKATNSTKTARVTANSGANTFSGVAYYVSDTEVYGMSNSTEYHLVIYGVK